MTVAEKHTISKPLTYEDYLVEGEVMARYDIIDGARVYMTQPTDGHQEIALNIAELFRAYQRKTKSGRTAIPPRDVLITEKPLRTRQPDVFYISNERYSGRTREDSRAYKPAPELVVEIVSPSETRASLRDKITDYCLAGVLECWIVSPEAETVEVLRLSAEGSERVDIYGYDQTFTSVTFSDLTVNVMDLLGGDDEP